MTRREWLALWAASTTDACVLARHPAPLVAASAADEGQTAPAASSAGDPTTWSVAELGAAFARGAATPEEVTAAYLDRITSLDPTLGAFITVARDRARNETRRLVQSSTASGPRAPLFGVPVAHKDLLATRGVRTTGGSRLHADWVPDIDADLVGRCTRAGMVVLGKTNTHELGGGVTTSNPFFGTTRNPRDVTRIPGGSSGGSAAAVAARLTLVATGTDTGGSTRIPAALCGCVGVKPTFGTLPTTGVLGASPSFDHVGILTRTVDDAVRVFAALLTPDDAAAIARVLATCRAAADTGLGRLRIGVPRAYFCEALDPAVAAAFEAALGRARAAGATVSDVSLGIDDGSYDALFAPTVVHEIRATYLRDWRRRPDAFSSDFAAVFEGPAPSDAARAKAMAARDVHTRALDRLFSTVDVLALPTVPSLAPPIAGPIDGMRILRNTWVFNASGAPALSLPCQRRVHDLPVGLQLVAARRHDARLLGIAAAWARALET